MAAGDETIIGPYAANTAGFTSMGAAMDTAYVGANDQYVSWTCANGLEIWCIHIEGA